ncbi:MAG: hypothetical protein L5657_03185, partial [Calditerricola sp.]|nr:hypothetical protein [Calditerricola sp.]
HVAKSLFPPSPGVIYGALRTLFFSHHPDVFARLEEARRKGNVLYGKPGVDPTAALRLRGLYVAYRDTLLLPLPADCVKEGKAKDQEATGQGEPTWVLKRLSIGEADGTERDAFLPASNSPLPEVLISPLPEDRRVEPLEQALCTAEDFAAYLAGTSARGPVPLSLHGGSEGTALLGTEYKVGIARRLDTGHVEKGMLYRVGMVRLNPEVSLVVDYEVEEAQQGLVPFALPKRGVLRLGGEGRMAAFVHEEPRLCPAPAIDPRLFKVVLLTPALFDNGWYPGWLDARSGYPGTFRGVRVRLVAAAVGRYVPIGGFDMARRKPKAMMRAVPAGAVYYFSAVDDVDPARVCEAFHHASISDHRAEEGFGVAVVGRVHTD